MPLYKKYDWEEIRRIYIEGYSNNGNGQVVFLSLKELSDVCKVGYGYLRLQAAKEKWIQKRAIYRKKLEYSKKHEVAKLLANKGVEFDSKTLELAKAGVLQIKAYFLAHRILMKNAKRKKKNIPLLDSKVIEQLAKSLLAFQKVGKVALGEELPPERLQNKITIEFLKEEKILTEEQRGQFMRVILKAEKEISSNGSKPATDK